FIPYDALSHEDVVARGAYGEISRAFWPEGEMEVALKGLHNDLTEDLVHEINNYSPDLENNKYYFVLQYANGGSLRNFLRQRFNELNWETKKRMAVEISNGLSVMHNNNIVHRDLHSGNVLIHNNQMKISDFGLSKYVNISPRSIIGGTVAYTDPQYLQDSRFIRDKASDVYSFGVLMWEISSGQTPYRGMGRNEIHQRVINGYREQPVNGTPLEYVTIYRQAWDSIESLRPSIQNIRFALSYMNMTPVYNDARSSVLHDPGPTLSIGINSIDERFHELRVIDPEDSDIMRSDVNTNITVPNPSDESICEPAAKGSRNAGNKYSLSKCNETLDRFIDYLENHVKRGLRDVPEKCAAAFHIYYEDTEGLEYHLEHGESGDDVSPFFNGDPLVVIAAQYCTTEKMVEIFEVLKRHNANFACANELRRTAFHIIYKNKLIFQKEIFRITLAQLCVNLKGIFKFLVENNCNVNARDFLGRPVISYFIAAKEKRDGYSSIIALLLESGANPNMTIKVRSSFIIPPDFKLHEEDDVLDTCSRNSLFLAIKHKWKVELFDLLLSFGVNEESLDNEGHSILLFALSEKNHDAMRWILENIPSASTKESLSEAIRKTKILSAERSLLKKWDGNDGKKNRENAKRNYERKKSIQLNRT
ncbi:14859_t:CDS:2, partial [Acaulospora colombiana]